MDEDGLPIVGSGIDLAKVPAIQQKRTVAFLNQFVVHTVQFLNRFSTVCEEKLSALSLRIQQIETTLNILDAKKKREETFVILKYATHITKLQYEVALAIQALARSSCPLCKTKLSLISLHNKNLCLSINQNIKTTDKFNKQYNITSVKLTCGVHEDVKFEGSNINMNTVTNGPVAQATTDQQTTVSPQSGQNSVPEEGLQKTEVVTENIRTVAKDPRYARYLKMVQVGVPVMAIRNKMISEGLNPDLLETPDAPVPAWGEDGNAEESSDSESSFSD